MATFYIHTLGCPKNQVDSDDLSETLIKKGNSEVESLEEADYILINTCGFIKEAKEESIDEILRIVYRKEDSQKVVVFGCLAERYKKELRENLPEVDAFFGVNAFQEIANYMGNNGSSGTTVLPRHWMPYEYLKISEGCNRRCSFCVIPSIRGRHRSLPPDRILLKAEEYLRRGTKELILVAQDLLSYGREFKGYGFVELLRDLEGFSGQYWIRLLYLHPNSIHKRLLEETARSDKICHYLDVPIQHSQDRILHLMGRGGSRERLLRLFKEIREIIPDVVLRTTVIVGFPSETEEDFQDLLSFVEQVRFNHLGAFLYSDEEGTRASKIGGKIDEKIKKERYHRIMTLQAEISEDKNRELLSKKLKVLIDEKDKDLYIGRYYGQAPEIDGVTLIESEYPLQRGQFYKAVVTEAYDYDLKARI